MLTKFILSLLRAYQKYVRPILPLCCRFEPSCSQYCVEAILKYGLLKGALKGINRILHCQPFSGKSGYDPLI